MADTLDLVRRGLTGPASRGHVLSPDAVPLSALSEFRPSRVRPELPRYAGESDSGSTAAGRNPRYRIRRTRRAAWFLAGRAVTVAPGETCTLRLPTK